jgi:hypothetical protein
MRDVVVLRPVLLALRLAAAEAFARQPRNSGRNA